MKLITITFTLLLLSNLSFSQNRKIAFETGTFADLKAKAKKENKIIFIDAYTTWCGPCKWMDKNIFTNDTIADYYNKTFVNAKIDMEKGEGLEIAKMYTVQCYPTYLFIDAEGNLLHRLAGSRNVKEFIQVAEDAQNPKVQYAHFAKEYDSKKTDPNFLFDYIDAAAATCMDYEVLKKEYFATQKEADLTTNRNWRLMFYFSNSMNDQEIKYFFNHIEDFQKAHTADSVNMKIENLCSDRAREIAYSKTAGPQDFENFKKEIAAINFTTKEATIFDVNLMYYAAKKDWVKYSETVVEGGDKYVEGINKKNSIGWNLFEKSDDVKALTIASNWLKNEFINDPSTVKYMFYDTYAALLFKLKNKAEAKAAVDKAIELAKAEEMEEADYQGTLDLKKEIDAMK